MPVLDLTPVNQPLRVERQTDNTLEFHLTTAADVDVDITNDAVSFTARDEPEGTQTIFLSNGVGEHATPLEGRTRFTLTKALLVAASGKPVKERITWVYEVRRTLAAGDQVVYFSGDLVLDPVVGLGA